MTDPLKILKHEHRIIERVLRALDGLCARLESGERVPAEALFQPIDFIRTFADGCHHKKEETHLFPALQQCGIPREGGPVGVMLYEHEIGRGLIADLARAAEGYRRGDVEASQLFAKVAREYIGLLTEHIRKEDNILFKIAEDVLDDPTRAKLGEAFARAEVEQGAGTHEQLEPLAAELEDQWAIGVGEHRGHPV